MSVLIQTKRINQISPRIDEELRQGVLGVGCTLATIWMPWRLRTSYTAGGVDSLSLHHLNW